MLEKIVEMLGASPTQYRYLLQTEKLMEKRALEGENKFAELFASCGLVFLFYNQYPTCVYTILFPL